MITLGCRSSAAIVADAVVLLKCGLSGLAEGGLALLSQLPRRDVLLQLDPAALDRLANWSPVYATRHAEGLCGPTSSKVGFILYRVLSIGVRVSIRIVVGILVSI